MKTKIDLSDGIVKVGPHEYKILLPYLFRERTDSYGQADHGMKEIRVSELDQGGNKRPRSAILVTLMHEIIHCVDEVYCDRSSWSDDQREHYVSSLAEGLVQALGIEEEK